MGFEVQWGLEAQTLLYSVVSVSLQAAFSLHLSSDLKFPCLDSLLFLTLFGFSGRCECVTVFGWCALRSTVVFISYVGKARVYSTQELLISNSFGGTN